MLRVLICLVSVLVMSPTFAASLHVKAGETITISEDQSRLQLDELILEDNSKIKFSPEVLRWQVRAAKVSVGNNVEILGVGKQGADGELGSDTGGQAKDCEDGQAGAPGQQGGKGTAGVAVTLDLKIASWGSLKISNSGGDGGNGGEGGQGQQAGKIDKCSQTRGGAGGVGGDGGDGGNGGNVRIRYSYLSDSKINAPLDKLIEVNNHGGAGGASGKGGAGGEGSEGRYINMRTLSGSKKWVPGGKNGAEGAEGKPGRGGVDGQIVIEEDLANIVDQRMQQQTAEVNLVRQQLQKALAEETARVAAEAQKKQAELATQNQALLDQLEQYKNKAASTQANADELNNQVSVLNQTQTTQLTKIDALEARLIELQTALVENRAASAEAQAQSSEQNKQEIKQLQLTVDQLQSVISDQQKAQEKKIESLETVVESLKKELSEALKKIADSPPKPPRQSVQ